MICNVFSRIFTTAQVTYQGKGQRSGFANVGDELKQERIWFV